MLSTSRNAFYTCPTAITPAPEAGYPHGAAPHARLLHGNIKPGFTPVQFFFKVFVDVFSTTFFFHLLTCKKR